MGFQRHWPCLRLPEEGGGAERMDTGCQFPQGLWALQVTMTLPTGSGGLLSSGSLSTRSWDHLGQFEQPTPLTYEQWT